MELHILTLCYLIGSVTFILGLKMLSNPASARKGNWIAAAGMAVAIFGTIFLYKDEEGNALGNYGWIFAALVLGSIIGTLTAKKVKMTAMPELVSLFNGMGGACASLISIIEFRHLVHASSVFVDASHLLIILLGLIIGTVSFSGSMIAWGKLHGRVKDFAFPGQLLVTMVLLGLLLGCFGIHYF